MKAPQGLQDCKGWLLWRLVQLDGEPKPRKIPYYVNGRMRSGGQGSPEDRAALSSYSEALARYQGGGFDGLGFAMLPDWGLVALDFDNAVNADGTLLEEVERLVVGTYAEWSPSGKGIHAFFTGSIASKKSLAKDGQFGFETFCGTGFLTFTGRPIDSCVMFGAEDTLADLGPEVLALFQRRFPGVSTELVGTSSEDALALMVPVLGLSDDSVREILADHDPDCDYLTWLNVGMALHHETDGTERGLALWVEWSEKGAKYPGLNALEAKWDSFGRNVSRAPVTMRSVKRKAQEKKHADDIILDAIDPMSIARRYVDDAWQGEDGTTLIRSCGLWYRYTGPHWEEVDKEVIGSKAWLWLEKVLRWYEKKETEKGKPKEYELGPFKPTPGVVGGVVEALQAVTMQEGAVAPCWLPGSSGADPRDLISLSNGILHVGSRRLLPHTSSYFNVNSLPFGWDDEGVCPTWARFLGEAFQGDPESVDTLQEMMGYLLTADTSQQKMFLICGPKRSGKGTIGRVIGALVGKANMASPTLGSLTSNFGLQPLIDKLVALIPDARVGGQTNTQAIVERLLMISGEDDITVDRKNKTAWSGKMPTRVVMLTNELPRLGDASGAITSRFITLVMRRSFFGKEDPTLTDKLMQELPAIFRWALDGLDRLRQRGRFIQPSSAQDDIDELAELNSPLTVFVDECCKVGEDFTCEKADLYAAYANWAHGQGMHPMAQTTFGMALKATVPGVSTCRPWGSGGGSRPRIYKGLQLRDSSIF